jgi:hypothetical protein
MTHGEINVKVKKKILWDVYEEYDFFSFYFRVGSFFVSSLFSEVCKVFTVVVFTVLQC